MDWLGAALNVIGLYLLPKQKYWAMGVFVATNIVFMVWAVTVQSWAILLLQVVLLILNIRTIYIWRQDNDPVRNVSDDRPNEIDKHPERYLPRRCVGRLRGRYSQANTERVERVRMLRGYGFQVHDVSSNGEPTDSSE